VSDGPHSYGDPELEEGANPLGHLMRVVRDPVGVLRRRWLWMTLALLLGAAGVGAGVTMMQPRYEAQAQILVSAQQIPEDFVRSTVRENSLDNLNAMVGEILSRKNLSEVIDRHRLYGEDGDEAAREQLVQRLRGAVAIAPMHGVTGTRGGASQVFGVSFTYHEPEAAAAVANDLAHLFVEASVERRSRQARTTTEFLRRELERADRELREVNQKISDYQQEHRGELPGDLQPTLAKLERLEQKRQSLTREIGERDERIAALSQDEEGELAPEPERELANLRVQLLRELGIHTREHPNVQALEQRIQRLEKQIEDNPEMLSRSRSEQSRALEAERRERELLVEQLEQTRQTMEELDARVDRIPGRGEELSALERRADVLREKYLEFLRKVQDAELAETLESAQQGPRVETLESARPPRQPVQPPIQILALGMIGVLGLAGAVGLGLELLDPVILEAEQLDDLLGAPALGSLPRL